MSIDVKKIVLVLVLGIFTPLLALSTRAFAASLYPMNGPYCEAIHGCTEVNGWYTGQLVWDQCASQQEAGYDWFSQGDHYYTYSTDNNQTVLRFSLDGVDQYGAEYCNPSSPSGQVTNVVWQGEIKYDTVPPTISTTSPSNNTNTGDSTIQVAGTVSTISGVQSVTVNGTPATVQGNSWSVTMPLTIGINSFVATATDVAGHQTPTSATTVFRYELPSSASPVSTGSSGTTSSTSPATPLVKSTGKSNSTASGSPSTGTNVPANTKTATTPSAPISAPVKAGVGAGAVAGAGLATASYLGYIPYKKIGLLVGKFFLK